MGRHPHHRCCFILLLCLLPDSSLAKNVWAIDCGATEPADTWEVDESYVHGGVKRTVDTDLDDTFKTLRAFEAEKPSKGCYTIPVGKGTKVLATTWFYYGNYDGLSKPPSFQLQFDSSDWFSVETIMDDWFLLEYVYVSKSNTTSICVARGSTGQTPFISTLRVVILDMGMYNAVNSSMALFMRNRVAFGANETFWDNYHRRWAKVTQALNILDYRIIINEATLFINETNLLDNVPVEALQTAITPSSPTELDSPIINITAPFLQSTPVPIYFSMYFTEPFGPAEMEGENRSFNIFLDDKQLIFHDSGAVIPPYGSAIEYSSAHQTGSSASIFTLKSTVDATLPPVISAWELFTITVLGHGTDSRDVNGLSALQDKFTALQDWAGDPCLPDNYNWEWVKCSGESPPRIIKLNLTGYGLLGELPDFSSMDKLETIDLSNNSLSGHIPEFLAELPKLQKLNLAQNDFASIPSKLIQNSIIQLDVSGNPQLPCGGQACSPAGAPAARLGEQPNSSVKQYDRGITEAILLAFIIYSIVALVL